jgi:hypothetical protein
MKKLCAKIDVDKTLKKVLIDDAELITGHGTDGGAELIGYYRNDKLVKITNSVGLSWGLIDEVFYFENDQIIHARETQKVFFTDPETGAKNGESYVKFTGNYFYQKMQLWEESKLGTKYGTGNKKTDAMDMVKNAKKYTELLKTKK